MNADAHQSGSFTLALRNEQGHKIKCYSSIEKCHRLLVEKDRLQGGVRQDERTKEMKV